MISHAKEASRTCVLFPLHVSIFLKFSHRNNVIFIQHWPCQCHRGLLTVVQLRLFFCNLYVPISRKLCQYFRNWTTESWRAETELNHRIWPVGLAAVTGALYALYGALLALHAAALWAIEPLCPDDEKTPANEIGVKITNYVEEVASRTNSSIKHWFGSFYSWSFDSVQIYEIANVTGYLLKLNTVIYC